MPNVLTILCNVINMLTGSYQISEEKELIKIRLKMIWLSVNLQGTFFHA